MPRLTFESDGLAEFGSAGFGDFGPEDAGDGAFEGVEELGGGAGAGGHSDAFVYFDGAEALELAEGGNAGLFEPFAGDWAEVEEGVGGGGGGGVVVGWVVGGLGHGLIAQWS